MSVQLSIICENTVGRPIAARGEHGFACLLDTPHGCWLFDTGSGETLLENLNILGHDANRIDAVILSHGHSDHCGGLLPLLQTIGSRPVYAHPQIFAQRYWQGQHERRDISIPYTRLELESAGAEFRFVSECVEIGPNLFFSGTIPRLSEVESGDPHLVTTTTDNSPQADTFPDDAALALKTDQGLVILLGCAHAGLINTTEHFMRSLGPQQVHAIIGGTHLGPAGDEQFDATLEYLGRLKPKRLGVSHCTGQIRSAQLFSRLPNKVFFANVGTTVNFDQRSA